MKRAARIIDGHVATYCMVDDFDADHIDPLDSLVGDSWDGAAFARSTQTIADLAAGYLVAVQERLDGVAKAWGYDSLAVAVTYAEEPAVPRFQNEGIALRAWRSLVWATCYELLAQAEAGTIPVPTLADVTAALPAAPEQPGAA